MKLLLLLVALIPLVLELSSAAPVTSLDPYGRVSRNSRMSRNNYGQELQDEDEEEADDEDEDEDDDELYDGIYPPDFNKLFPSPDATSSSRPEGGSGGPQGHGNHPTRPQQGRPGYGPASLQGPAALKGPAQAQHGQRQGGVGHGGPPPGGPPPNYRRGGPPPSGPAYRGPPPQYRVELNEVDEEEETIPEGRQLMSYGRRRVVAYPNRRVVAYPQRRLTSYPMYQNRMSYPRYPMQSYNGNKWAYTPRYTTPLVRRYRTEVESSLEQDTPGPVVFPRSQGARIYNPWAHNPLRADAYNPEFIVDPTEMRSRRRFRYHPSQIIPSQRIPVYSGTWGNPRNHYVHSQTGAHYGGPYWASQI